MIEKQKEIFKEAIKNCEIIFETQHSLLKSVKKQRDELLEACKKVLIGFDRDAVQNNGEWQTGLFCGLEDRNITNIYDACLHGYEKALDRVMEWSLGEHLEQAIANAESEL